MSHAHLRHLLAGLGLMLAATQAQAVTTSLPAALGAAQHAQAVSQLRATIERTYRASQQLVPKEADAKATAALQPYFPQGISYEQAEALLRDAGFTLDTDPFHFPKRAGERHDRTRAQLLLGHSSISATQLLVDLIPAQPEVFQTVGHIECRMITDIP